MMKWHSTLFTLLSGTAIAAVPFDDINTSLTRKAADGWMDNNYEFKILQDYSVRRIWKEDNRTISLDFNAENQGNLFMAEIKYKKPISTKAAEKDARSLAQRKTLNWKKAKASSVREIGIDKADYVKLKGKSYIFRELSDEGKVTRLVLFGVSPVENRFILLDAAEVVQSGSTPMGASFNENSAKALVIEEDGRRSRPRGNAVAKKDNAESSEKKEQNLSPEVLAVVDPHAKQREANKIADAKAKVVEKKWSEYIVYGATILLGLFALFIFGAKKKKGTRKSKHRKY